MAASVNRWRPKTGKKNTGSHSRSKTENGNKGAIHFEKGGNSGAFFHTVLRHGVTSSKIHWAYYTEAAPGLQGEISMMRVQKIMRKLWKFTEKALAIN